jgi:hypothetical protein
MKKTTQYRKANFPTGHRTLKEIRQTKPRKPASPSTHAISSSYLSQAELNIALQQLKNLR